jgi:hypothetical protein
MPQPNLSGKSPGRCGNRAFPRIALQNGDAAGCAPARLRRGHNFG